MSSSIFNSVMNSIALEFNLLEGGDSELPTKERFVEQDENKNLTENKPEVKDSPEDDATNSEEEPEEDPQDSDTPPEEDDTESPEDDNSDDEENLNDTDDTGTEDDPLADDAMGDDDLGADDADPTGSSDNTHEKLIQKMNLRKLMCVLHSSISASLDSLYKCQPPENDEACTIFFNVQAKLGNCKDILFEMITSDMKYAEYTDILRRYQAIDNVYDICISILDKIIPQSSNTVVPKSRRRKRI